MSKLTHSKINEAAEIVGKTWPLYSFVTSNPLIGLENSKFELAVEEAGKLLKASVYPSSSTFGQALSAGEIDRKVLTQMLERDGFSTDIGLSLDKMTSPKGKKQKNQTHQVDRILVKWLSEFLDEGLADWEMPYKSEGFYKAWRALAVYDGEIGEPSLAQIPDTSETALADLLSDYSEEERTLIYKYHFAALPGWVGYIKHRIENNTQWQQRFPIYLEDYLAVRLMIAKFLNLEILPSNATNDNENDVSKLQHVWLKSWEKSFQNYLTSTLTTVEKKLSSTTTKPQLPEAQLIFCIDTRSELIRRRVEAAGDYETFGYAGFFGIAMDYKSPDDGITRKSCPPIVGSAYKVFERPQPSSKKKMKRYLKRVETQSFASYFLKRMKNMLPSAFGYVEASGAFYGLSMLGRTLFPGFLYSSNKKDASSYEYFSEPTAICRHEHHHEIPLQEQISIVKSAFDLMGFTAFAPLIIVVGHGSHSANNPFGSSLDCGACAASPGRHNARLFAHLANLAEVRNGLKDAFEIAIPNDTVFIAAEHNTTTDDIVLFDSSVPATHQHLLEKLKEDLKKSQLAAAIERSGNDRTNSKSTYKKANNWAETRPEWGLAKNAGFIVAPRALTKDINLNSRCFLNSYNWELDKEAKVLESIMQGPMVVTQWINNHYYFATVDNEKFGGGSKITHNVTGKFGVVQGNGGDLKTGLPLQSLMETDEKMFHQPLRLSVLIQSPIGNIEEILNRNENLKTLLDNQWIYLMVMDPTKGNEIQLYQEGMKWKPETGPNLSAETLNNNFSDWQN